MVATLRAHKDRVNCLTWIRYHSCRDDPITTHHPVGELLSGSVDNTIVAWRKASDNQVNYWLSW